MLFLIGCNHQKAQTYRQGSSLKSPVDLPPKVRQSVKT